MLNVRSISEIEEAINDGWNGCHASKECMSEIVEVRKMLADLVGDYPSDTPSICLDTAKQYLKQAGQ